MTESAKLSGAKPRLYHTPSSYYSMIARLALAEGDIAEYALGSTPDDETKTWVDLHYGYPIEELTFGGILARNPLARIMIPKRLDAAPPPPPPYPPPKPPLPFHLPA